MPPLVVQSDLGVSQSAYVSWLQHERTAAYSVAGAINVRVSCYQVTASAGRDVWVFSMPVTNGIPLYLEPKHGLMRIPHESLQVRRQLADRCRPQVGSTALHLAVANMHTAVVRELLRAGADALRPNQVRGSGLPAHAWAPRTKHFRAILLLYAAMCRTQQSRRCGVVIASACMLSTHDARHSTT
jgi:hypothetical protein